MCLCLLVSNLTPLTRGHRAARRLSHIAVRAAVTARRHSTASLHAAELSSINPQWRLAVASELTSPGWENSRQRLSTPPTQEAFGLRCFIYKPARNVCCVYRRRLIGRVVRLRAGRSICTSVFAKRQVLMVPLWTDPTSSPNTEPVCVCARVCFPLCQAEDSPCSVVVMLLECHFHPHTGHPDNWAALETSGSSNGFQSRETEIHNKKLWQGPRK